MKESKKKLLILIPSFISFLVYLSTMAPSVIQIDAGELAAVQYTAGIAHPTGYPLFTMIGYLFVHLPLPFTKIFLSNLLAAIFCSAAVLIFSYSLKIILDNFALSYRKSLNEKNKKSQEDFVFDGVSKTILIFAGSLFLAFSKTFWFQSTSVEVYSLHLLLINILIYVLLRITFRKKDGKSSLKTWLVFSIFLALGFTNHLTTVLIIPAVTYIFFKSEGISKKSIFLLFRMLFLFFVVLGVIYSYLPLRASADPALNWGNPETLENFWRHFRGVQYSSWIFSSFESAKKQFFYFISNFPHEFSIPGIVLIITGIIFSFRQLRHLFYFTCICAISTIAYSINYDIVDIDAYFLLAYIAFSVFAFFGLMQLVIFLRNRFHTIILLLILFAPVIYLGWSNFETNNQSDNYIFEDYTKGILNSVEKQSVIFSYQWDYFISASYYFQLVENFRSDVNIIDKELLRRSWYYNQVTDNDPEIFQRQRENINAFLKALQPFEQGGNFNPQLLEETYQRVMTNLVADNIGERNFYIGIELLQNELRNNSFRLPQGCQIVPHLFLFRVVNNPDYVPAPDPDFVFRRLPNENKYTEFICNSVFNMLTMRALYELSFNKIDNARIYANKISQLFPEKPLHSQLREL